MKKIIQKFGMEMLSKDEMRNITGGNPPNVNVTCDICYNPNECFGSRTGTCPGDTADSCNGIPAGVDTILLNCVDA